MTDAHEPRHALETAYLLSPLFEANAAAAILLADGDPAGIEAQRDRILTRTAAASGLGGLPRELTYAQMRRVYAAELRVLLDELEATC